MNTLVIVLIAAVCLFGAYALYGRWLANKWGIDPTAKTPAAPSQLKAFYEPVMDTEGVDIMDKKEEVKPLETTTTFELPDFGQKTKVTGAAVGSATHELMQRLILSDKVTLQDLTQALSRVSADDQVKARVQLEKLLGFFDTELGKLILANRGKLRREAPFAMLAEDPASKEDFVVRGIIDGYLLLEDRIVLFDYKTDRFTHPSELKERYKGQMSLYAKALSQAYQISASYSRRYLPHIRLKFLVAVVFSVSSAYW